MLKKFTTSHYGRPWIVRHSLWFICLILCSVGLNAQNLKISGKIVSDEEGSPPVIGVNVFVKGSTIGTITDVDGVYEVDGVPQNSTLVFSFIGFMTQEINVGSQTNIDVVLAADVAALDEVVVIGYGEQRKETLTGSVSSVKGVELVKSPTANVTSSLAGRLPGLIVNQRSGQPGADDPNLLIRGNGTFDSNTGDGINPASPLIIIDGVPRSFMGRLNPSDIESISVLKDASAAIYGARAANGVILITTKKGALGKPEFNVSMNQSFSAPTKIVDVMDAATYAQVFNEAEWYRAGRPATYTPFYSADAIKKYADGSDPVLYPNTDWVGEMLRPHSVQQRINMSVAGGTQAAKYFLSFGYMNQDGNFRNTPVDYNQYNFRLTTDINVSKHLTIGANISAILNKTTNSAVNNNTTDFTNIILANPTLVARYPNGLIAPGRLGENPLLVDQRGLTSNSDSPIYSTLTATYQIPGVEGLKLTGSYNYDLNNRFEKRFVKPYFYNEYNVNTQNYDRKQGTGSSTTELWDTYNRWTTRLANARINYNKLIGDDHNIGAMLGVERQQNDNIWAQAYRRNFVSSAIDQINVGSTAPEDKNNGGSTSASAYNNYFGRFNYSFKGRYLAEVLFRYDGSQIFPNEKRYGFFPAMSAGWLVSEESFMQGVDFVDFLKLRGSFGQIGNDRVAPYQYLQSFSFGQNYVFGSGDVPGIFPNTLPNPNITWEVSEKLDLGVEATMLKGLLGVNFTLWNQNRSNILAKKNVSISNVLGFSAIPDENIGEVKSHGFELELSHNRTVGEFRYRIGGSTSFARSKIIFMDEVPQDEEVKSQTGRPVGAGLFYQADGVFNTKEELESSPRLANAQLGDTKIVDLNGDGMINAADQFRFNYTATPEIVFGLNFDLSYKSFDLNMFFQGQTNAYNYDGGFASLGNSNFDNASVYRSEDRWSVDNPNGSLPRAADNAPSNNTMWLFDATFARLKNMEIGYSLPASLSGKAGLSQTRIYLSGSNLLTWAKEIKWADPEMNGGFLYYPQQRVLNIGANVKF